VPDQALSRWDQGLRRYREIYGPDAHVFAQGQVPAFDIMIEQLFGEVWVRKALDISTRRLLVMGVLAAQREFDTLQVQFERALASDELTEAQVREVVVHLVQYVGYPSMSGLLRAAETAIGQR
jgi:4-carboxymuconolactone decarboxylase